MKTFPILAAKAAVAAALAALTLPAAAQDAYPSRPVTIVVPFAAGSSTDTVGRTAAAALEAQLGQRFVVENKTGAGGIIGTESVARAKPDGYTLLIGTNSTHAANVKLFKSLPYDPVKDFAPITDLSTQCLMLMTHPSVPAKTVAELVAYGKANPGVLKAGYSASSSQISVSVFGEKGGFKYGPVSYRSTPPTVTDLLGGHISYTFADFSNSIPHIDAGKAVGLAVTCPVRTPLAPNTPTMKEAGIDYELIAWQGLFAPAGTPPAVVKKIHDALKAAYDTPDVRKRYNALGFEVDFSPSPEHYADFIKAEAVKWSDMVVKAGIEPQ